MLNALAASLSGRVIRDTEEMAPFLIDWRKTWRGVALAVVQPDSTADVAAVVRWCAEHRVSVVPQGGNTGQSGGSVPQSTGRNIVLSLLGMNRVRAIDVVDNLMTVDAGCVLQTVQETAGAHDRLFPLSLGAQGSCTVGGNMATNAGGTSVLRYGNARDLCLGLEVVTASGEVWNGLKGLRKDNSGYDLRDLFIGSEGTLGIITGAVLKLFPKPTGTSVAFVSVASPADAMRFFNLARERHAASLSAFELMSDTCLGMVKRHLGSAGRAPAFVSPWYVLVEFANFTGEDQCRAELEALLSSALELDLISDAVLAQSVGQSRDLWLLRDTISLAQGADGLAIKHDISVPISRVPDFIDQGLSAVANFFPDFRPVVFGHLGDGNLHFNFSSARGADQQAFAKHEAELNAIVHDCVRRFDGSISAEHGLGALRHEEANRFRSPVERTIMYAIKQALDPEGIMNPGKVIPGQQR